MHCLKCGTEVESDDNFCPECGHWTSKGYSFFHDRKNIDIINGSVIKQHNRLGSLFIIMVIFVIIFIAYTSYRGNDLLKPFIYTKRQILNKQYGYNTTIMDKDNQYFNQKVLTSEDAKDIIQKDFFSQQWKCFSDFETLNIEKAIEKEHNIISVSLCEISGTESQKIKYTIDNIYSLFPNIDGYLTNITLTNAKNSKDYVAYFQPIYEFVNSTNDINEYNKVNKTQILLNSYYFLDEENLNEKIPENWYVEDATYESLIAHEFGHYITFVSLLKTKGIDNITLVTPENEMTIRDIKNIINDESYSKEIVELAISNYNNKYNTTIEIEDFAKSISNYANSKDSDGYIVYDEIIAEAVHDYYLHNNNAKNTSIEIINILKSRLN